MRLLAFLLLPGAILMAQKTADPVVLTVGSEKITQSMFEQLMDSLSDQQRAQLTTPEARRSFAEQIAELKAMAQEAKARKLDQSPEVKGKIQLQTEQILASAVYQQMASVKPDDAMVQAYYAAHRNEWEKATARHILIRMQGSPVPLKPSQKDLSQEEALAKVKDLRAKIVAGAKFAEIAKAESDDVASGENGGDLGSFGKGEMVPEFDEAAFVGPVGQVSEPIQTKFGFHLLFVEKRESAPLDQVRDEIEQKIRPEIGQKGVDSVRTKTAIVFDDTYFGKPESAPAK